MGDGESDELKRILTEGNPYFLALTTLVSLLHSVFDMLAFKNDIGFWKGKKNVEGLSVRTILFNCGCQVRVCVCVCVRARRAGGAGGAHVCICMCVRARAHPRCAAVMCRGGRS